jgi:hypothetical protein
VKFVLKSQKPFRELEAFAVSEGERNAVAEGVEEIVLAVAPFIPDSETFDLLE